MADYNELLKLLNGQQDQEEPMMSVGEPASIPKVNEQAKSPYQEEAPEITPEQVLDMPKMQQDIADYSKSESQSAQEAKLRDTFEAIPENKSIGDKLRDTSAATPEKKPMDAREEYAKLIEQYKERLNKPQEGISWGDALPDILSGLYNIGVRAKGRSLPQMQLGSIERAKQSMSKKRQEDLTGLQNLQKMYQQYMAMNPTKEGMSPYQQAQIDLGMKRLELEAQKAKDSELKRDMSPYQQAQIDLERKKLELQTQKKEPSFEEKEKIKEQASIRKSNLETRKQAEKSISDLDSQLEKIRRAKSLLKESTKSLISDTGLIDQFISPMTGKGQKLQQAFNDLSLEKMSKLFQGMSKAVDSDAERKMFEQSQANMRNYPDVNMDILNQMEAGILSLKNKNKNLIQRYNAKGEEITEERKVDKKIQDYAEKYNLDYDRAEDILRKRGYNG